MLFPQIFLAMMALMGNASVTDAVAPQAGVRVTQLRGSTDVQEQGQTTDTYQIALYTIPAGPVSIAIATDGQTQISTDGENFLNSLSLTLDSTAPATITVRAVDDATPENTPHLGIITHTLTSSADPAYSNANTPITNVVVKIVDNDGAVSFTRLQPIGTSGFGGVSKR